MIIDAQIRSLQNFADKFNLTVQYYQFEDLRKKTKFVLTDQDKFISPKLNYNEMNHFLLGINSCKKNNL